jgi:non-canonical purine NTP pyrophosphatase (RdgB/HAM1 family)
MAENHDDSKMNNFTEVVGYTLRWVWNIEEKNDLYSRAWRLHFHSNPHHPEYYYSTKNDKMVRFVRLANESGEFAIKLRDLDNARMEDIGLAESVVDMFARHWEKDGSDEYIDYNNPTDSELINIESKHLNRYSAEDRLRVENIFADIDNGDFGTRAPLYFCTGNEKKFKDLSSRLGKLKNFNLKHKKMDLPELQSDSVADVAVNKALTAWRRIRHPLVVHDSGLCIEGLLGFPGTYLKYVSDTVGASGLLKLMNSVTNRSCYIDSCLVYVDACGNAHVFNEDKKVKRRGRIATKEELEKTEPTKKPTTTGARAIDFVVSQIWSHPNPERDFWSIIIPEIEGESNELPMTQLPSDKLERFVDNDYCYRQFAEWFKYDETIPKP